MRHAALQWHGPTGDASGPLDLLLQRVPGLTSPETVRTRVFVTGRVQGVWFRESCREQAVAAGVSGWVRNRSDGRVEDGDWLGGFEDVRAGAGVERTSPAGEVVFFPAGNGALDIMFQVDRRARGLSGLFSEAMGTDETNVRLSVTNADIPSLAQKIQTVIGRYS